MNTIDSQKTSPLTDAPPDVLPAVDPAIKAKATDAAVKFEAFFLKQMISQMRAGTRALADEDSPDKKRVNQDMLDLADGLVADALAQQRAFGIADLMLKQVLPQAANAPAARTASAAPDAALSSAPARSPSNGKTSA
ncbi:flagellar biosynthesis protein FlgJ [Roseateles sp.]|uniref:flagellar biosynthesis protein FlgJ n=1 Tax=Roseateles sp. TaxID=1971397 RepID=UPI0031D872EE